jgi:hypothetical protein
MKTALKLSLLANLLLGAVVCYYQIRLPAERAPAVFVTTTVPTSKLPPPAARVAFDWQQVEATDYPTYIANLRAIRCPEQTVRDIVKADVANLFAQQRQGLSNSPASGRWSPAEEARFLAVLFSEAVRQTVSGGSAEAVAAPVRLPLILQTQALASLKLSDEQRDELSQLTQQFIQEIGGTNQDPNDPAYLARWQKARPKFDEMIVRTIGRRELVDLDEAMPASDAADQ